MIRKRPSSWLIETVFSEIHVEMLTVFIPEVSAGDRITIYCSPTRSSAARLLGDIRGNTLSPDIHNWPANAMGGMAHFCSAGNDRAAPAALFESYEFRNGGFRNPIQTGTGFILLIAAISA